jgi:hypothetical protein
MEINIKKFIQSVEAGSRRQDKAVAVACSRNQVSLVIVGGKELEVRYMEIVEDGKGGIGQWGWNPNCFHELEGIFEENLEENKV